MSGTEVAPRRLLWQGLALAAVIVVLDQVTKLWALDALFDPPRRITLLPVLDLVPVWNSGVSFGMFSDGGETMRYVLTGFAAAVSVALVVWLSRVNERLVAGGLALIIGGAVGNVIDRLRFGAVVDFVLPHWQGWAWPAFNLADTAITFGVVLLLLDGFRKPAQGPADPT